MTHGAPSKFTPVHTKKFLDAIRKGATYELACNYARICYQTFRNWCIASKGQTQGAYFEFMEELKEAEGQAACKWLDVIDKAMDEGEWTAAAWKLERRHYKDYSRHTEVIGLSEEMEKFKDEFKDVKANNSEAK